MQSLLDSVLASPIPGLGWADTVLRLAAAMLMGGVLGWEREVHEKHAGLRTHMMIGLAACLFALITIAIIEDPLVDDESLRLDPIRLIEAVTAGVAFLAAGTIFTSRGSVKGLTTGASMWLAGSIGTACGLGHLGLAGLATLLALIVLWLLKILVRQALPPGESDVVEPPRDV